jgi:Ca2+-binding RTX toxin-like protein
VPSPIDITTDLFSTLTLLADHSSVTVNPGITIAGPHTGTGFALDAGAGAGGTITVHGTLTGGGGIYDPSTTRRAYNVTISHTGFIEATNGYGIALQKQANVVNHGTIAATKIGISIGDGSGVVVNTGLITAEQGIQTFGNGAVIGNAGTLQATADGMFIIGNDCTITNGGTIHSGRYGIALSEAAGFSTVVTNTGMIHADVLAFRGSAAGNVFVNRGAITGNIDMHGGDDVFDSRSGTIAGTVLLSSGNARAFGGSGNETFSDGFGNDTIDAGDGIDTLSYVLSTDPGVAVTVDLSLTTAQVNAWGTDVFLNFENVTGAAGNDTIKGSDADNVLKGLAGADSLSGRDGNDTLIGGAGNDVLDGGDGSDTADFSGGTSAIVDLRFEVPQDTGMGNDILLGIENLIGGSASDRLTGSAAANVLAGGGGADLLSGEAGADSLNGGAGNDVLDGGAGRDTAVFVGARSSYTIVANADGTFTVTDLVANGDGADVLRNVEAIRFTLTGEALDLASLTRPLEPPVTPPPNPQPTSLVLRGTSGADRLTGGTGNDTLFGKAGKDALTGGSGQDAFVFDTKLTARTAVKNKDTIVDFGPLYDSLYFDDAAFGNTTIARYLKGKNAALDRAIAIKRGWLAFNQAKDRDDFFIAKKVNAKTYKLFFDADGSGTKKALEIATVKLQTGEGTALAYKDVFFV